MDGARDDGANGERGDGGRRMRLGAATGTKKTREESSLARNCHIYRSSNYPVPLNLLLAMLHVIERNFLNTNIVQDRACRSGRLVG